MFRGILGPYPTLQTSEKKEQERQELPGRSILRELVKFLFILTLLLFSGSILASEPLFVARNGTIIFIINNTSFGCKKDERTTVILDLRDMITFYGCAKQKENSAVITFEDGDVYQLGPDGSVSRVPKV